MIPSTQVLLQRARTNLGGVCQMKANRRSGSSACPAKSGGTTSGVFPVTGNNHGSERQGSRGNAEEKSTDPKIVPAKCPFGYDAGTFKLGPLSCMICQALLHECSRCKPCSHKFCKACISRFNDCPLCGADIEGTEPDSELQALIDGHAQIKRSHAAGEAEVLGGKNKVIYDDVSMERPAFLVQQAMRAFRGQNYGSAKSRLAVCVEDIREELKSSDDNLDLCSQLGAVLGMLGDCWYVGPWDRDAPSAITYYEESAGFLSKLPAKDLEVRLPFIIISLNKIGDLRYNDGDLQSARSYYACSLDVRRNAVKEHSAVACQVIDLATSLAKIADVDRNLGNESTAVEGFKEAIECIEKLKLGSKQPSLEQRRHSVLDYLRNQLHTIYFATRG
ncbi:hypothetical protein U9M48_005157 [Paspalum notatum var. saurae]|uniref:RING-type domain-containing protein n=1 Tax=Paspalum notatum var. saurae TaxID=547442 RepID=A0AAQ3PX28_PASNO